MEKVQSAAITSHYGNVWKSMPEIDTWTSGPVHELPTLFQILCFAPTSTRSMWTYATCGMSAKRDSQPLELHLFAPVKNRELVELLTVVAYYHYTGASLGLGHTVNFGRPWLPGSRCVYGLITLPYLDGPDLEWLILDDRRVQFLWIIPVTAEEVSYKKTQGMEALERLFESANFNYADPLRKSVI
jgi:hypothetical protein